MKSDAVEPRTTIGHCTWEDAYARFETPEQEVRKFMRRLRKLGADAWPKDAQVIELFCGRGNGLETLRRLGFGNIEGADLSASLLAQYRGSSKTHLCDCRELPLPDRSKDVVIVQGGLHHLPDLLDDLRRVLREVNRVLRDNGRFMVVEPWMTPFLAFVHKTCRIRVIRRLSNKLDACATMIELEHPTYDDWLARPRLIHDLLEEYFVTERCWIAWGKLMFVGRPRR